MAFIALRVVCGLFAIAATFSPTNEFIMLDFLFFFSPYINTISFFFFFPFCSGGGEIKPPLYIIMFQFLLISKCQFSILLYTYFFKKFVEFCK